MADRVYSAALQQTFELFIFAPDKNTTANKLRILLRLVYDKISRHSLAFTRSIELGHCFFSDTTISICSGINDDSYQHIQLCLPCKQFSTSRQANFCTNTRHRRADEKRHELRHSGGKSAAADSLGIMSTRKGRSYATNPGTLSP